jgi:hypothetical protein
MSLYVTIHRAYRSKASWLRERLIWTSPRTAESPAKLAGRMKRRWRVILLRSKGELLGYVDASDAEGAKAAAATQFDLDEVRRNRIMVQELG